MNKFAHFFKRMFKKAGTYEECLNAVKAKYGAVGDAIYREPGVMVYKKTGSNDVLRITLNNFNQKSGFTNRGLEIDTLLPLDTTYKQYQSKVGELAGYTKTSKNVGPHRVIDKCDKVLNEVSPDRFEGRFAEGGLSRIFNYGKQSYFCPSTVCKI